MHRLFGRWQIWAEQILREADKPLTPVEIMVRVQEVDYVARSAASKVVESLTLALMGNGTSFFQDNEKWLVR